ncbi:unnamed protein product [Aureobasidium pullulans]|nr:unnamed protein product [Aureobasidium pullulans]
MLAEMQPHESPKQSIVSAAYDILVQTATILTKFCSGRKTEKSGTIYDWETRLAYVGVDDLDEDSEENQEHDEGLTLERSCGVMRYKD